ncbi:zinc ribbon domain-containing protein [Candidatus Poribacteria bacterium]|nr:zinc ribbon domain-containing protein [Candidatus Poribacteria bacterium]
MPIYEYECASCGKHFSLLRRVSDDDRTIECPECQTAHPKRLYSTFAASAGAAKPTCSLSPKGCSPSGPFR